MSDKPIPPLPAGVLTEEQIASISGGGCTPEEIISILGELKGAYEQMIDFTSYVIERVAGP